MAICRNGAVCFPEKTTYRCLVGCLFPFLSELFSGPAGCCVPHFGHLGSFCAVGLENAIFTADAV